MQGKPRVERGILVNGTVYFSKGCLLRPKSNHDIMLEKHLDTEWCSMSSNCLFCCWGMDTEL